MVNAKVLVSKCTIQSHLSLSEACAFGSEILTQSPLSVLPYRTTVIFHELYINYALTNFIDLLECKLTKSRLRLGIPVRVSVFLRSRCQFSQYVLLIRKIIYKVSSSEISLNKFLSFPSTQESSSHITSFPSRVGHLDPSYSRTNLICNKLSTSINPRGRRKKNPRQNETV